MDCNRTSAQGFVSRSGRIPIGLIWLASCVLLATIFDGWVISNTPALRTIAGVFGVVLAVCWVWYRSKGFKIRRGAMVWTLMFLFAIVYVDLLRFADSGSVAVANSFQWLQVVFFGVILLDISQDDRAGGYLFASLLASSLLIAIFGILDGFKEGVRSGSDLANLNEQAYYFALMIIAIYVYIIERWPTIRLSTIIAGLTMIFLLVMLLATGSRGAVVAIVVGVVTATWFLRRVRNKSAYMFLIPLLLVGGTLLVLSSGSAERWQRTLEGEDYGYRDVIWSAAVEMVQERPLLGHGANFVTDLGARTRISKISTHNQYLMLVIAYGLSGLFLWVGILVSVVRRCWRHRYHPIAVALLSMILCSAVFGLASDLTFKRYFWVIIALAANVEVLVKKYPSATNRRAANKGGFIKSNGSYV